MKQTIEDIDVTGKRVLMRVDFNVPTNNGVITDDRRIQLALPSIKNVLDRGGTLTLLSHLGRPSGQGYEGAYTLQPVAARLEELLGERVVLSDEEREARVILRENLRFHPEEKKNDDEFAKKLASEADIYCNNAFGTAHRDHASMIAVPNAMVDKPKVAGMLLAKELQYLDQAIDQANQPFIAVLGGAKVSDKMGAIEHLLGKVDTILIGGAMAYTFLAAQGIEVGDSLIEEDRIEDARSMMHVAKSSATDVLLPTDHICTQDIKIDSQTKVVTGSIPNGWMGVDIGPETIETYTQCIQGGRTIVWNGPMGIFEKKQFEKGTRAIALAMATATEGGAITIVGGGDSAAAVSNFGLDTEMTHISTGGGASLQMLEGIAFSSVTLLDDAV